MLKVSRYTKKIAETSGISRLMNDLGHAIAGGRDVLMLGGGNPSHIPKVNDHFRDSILKLLENDEEFEQVIGNYDPPQGNKELIEALSRLLVDEYGWTIGPKNIALTNGSQSVFFILFNMFAGDFEGGGKRRFTLHFLPGFKAKWKHKHECIRINYAQDIQTVTTGLNIIADEVKSAYDSA